MIWKISALSPISKVLERIISFKNNSLSWKKFSNPLFALTKDTVPEIPSLEGF